MFLSGQVCNVTEVSTLHMTRLLLCFQRSYRSLPWDHSCDNSTRVAVASDFHGFHSRPSPWSLHVWELDSESWIRRHSRSSRGYHPTISTSGVSSAKAEANCKRLNFGSSGGAQCGRYLFPFLLSDTRQSYSTTMGMRQHRKESHRR